MTTKTKSYEKALQLARAEADQPDRIAALLTAAHETGDARATYALATWHLHGLFFGKDLRVAVRLLRQAAAQGILDALFDLAVCYERGEGVRVKLRKASQLYLRAALRDRQSRFGVARRYYHGIGVHKDRPISAVWRDRAEQLGIEK